VSWGIIVEPPTNEQGEDLYNKMINTQPQMMSKDFVKEILGMEKITRMGAGLRAVGLDCSMNTEDNLLQWAVEVYRSYGSGRYFLWSQKGDVGHNADFKLANAHNADGHSGKLGKLRRLFGPKYIDALDKEMNLHKVERNQSFQSSTIGGIKETLISVGNAIGNLENGNKLHAGEVLSVVTDALASLKEVSTSSVDEHRAETLGIVELDKDLEVAALGMITYDYSFRVENYKDKKIEEKKCDYSLTQKSLIFTNPTILEEVYKKICG